MRKAFALPVLTLALATNVWALGEARMTGKVLDSSNKPVAGVKITIDAMEARKVHQETTTNKDGVFAVFLLDGTIHYKFVFVKEGVGTYTETMKLKLSPEKNEKVIVLGAPVAAGSGAVAAVAKADPATEAFNAGAQLANSGDNAGAIAKLEEAVKINPEFSPAFSALARLYSRTSNWTKAIEYGLKAITADGEDEDINAILATAYQKTGNKVEAAKYASKAPKNATAIFNEAAKYINSGDVAKAEPLLKQAIEADPKFSQAYFELGMVYAGQSKNAEAKKYLTQYLEVDPKGKDATTAKEMLGYIK